MSSLEYILPRSPLGKNLQNDCDEDKEDPWDVEWAWENAGGAPALLSEDGRDVTFHPNYSVGTAAVRADTPLLPAHHHYWEVRILSAMHGTDVQVGVGTRAVPVAAHATEFVSLLGRDRESYGLSYFGSVQAAGAVVGRTGPGFCKGSLVGVLVDTWHGTLQFYVDREPHGPALTGLRRDTLLYPMISSTAARSAVRLTCAASRPASLQVRASRALAAAPLAAPLAAAPPGLALLLRAGRCRPFPYERRFDRTGTAPSTTDRQPSVEQRRRVRSPARRRASSLVVVGERRLLPSERA